MLDEKKLTALQRSALKKIREKAKKRLINEAGQEVDAISFESLTPEEAFILAPDWLQVPEGVRQQLHEQLKIPSNTLIGPAYVIDKLELERIRRAKIAIAEKMLTELALKVYGSGRKRGSIAWFKQKVLEASRAARSTDLMDVMRKLEEQNGWELDSSNAYQRKWILTNRDGDKAEEKSGSAVDKHLRELRKAEKEKS